MSPNPNNEEVDVVQQSLQGLSLQVIPAGAWLVVS
jgi:hypothetical protein